VKVCTRRCRLTINATSSCTEGNYVLCEWVTYPRSQSTINRLCVHTKAYTGWKDIRAQALCSGIFCLRNKSQMLYFLRRLVFKSSSSSIGEKCQMINTRAPCSYKEQVQRMVVWNQMRVHRGKNSINRKGELRGTLFGILLFVIWPSMIFSSPPFP
jgi:hypothetical protein